MKQACVSILDWSEQSESKTIRDTLSDYRNSIWIFPHEKSCVCQPEACDVLHMQAALGFSAEKVSCERKLL